MIESQADHQLREAVVVQGVHGAARRAERGSRENGGDCQAELGEGAERRVSIRSCLSGDLQRPERGAFDLNAAVRQETDGSASARDPSKNRKERIK
ncbi:hypothetical protein Snoj_42280 [Streptomyces nojiriensis]|uniref:Uncharacterized protein n=1 Tax=Streptomyces nojiriensis TaxID=66374 RepID=A0ABQ3SQ85_9ACTN|nr:hypothetical protein GCM10010205_10940 [Streptomyces nojiriensis]GHI70310.1 hypothetical protein Snoj_42280 [Streptomyces nojiriensis]